MNTESVTRYFQVDTDWQALGIAALFLTVMLMSLEAASWFIATPSSGVQPTMTETSSAGQAAAGGGLVIVEVIYASLILVGILAWRRLPTWVRDAVKPAVKYSAVLLVGALAAYRGMTTTALTVFLAAYLTFQVLDYFDVTWIVNNVFVLAVATVTAAAAGVMLPVPFFIVFFLGLTVYDHVFTNQRDWMVTLARTMVRKRLPVVFLVPRRLRVEWGVMVDELASEPDDEDRDIGFAIGTGDLWLPSAFLVSVAATASPGVAPVLVGGVVLGVLAACYRISWIINHRASAAGLPSLATGAIGGWAIASAVVLLLS